MRLSAPAAVAGGLRDVFGGRLGGLALLCFVVALAATIAASWAAFRFLVPMIPEGEGWLGYVWTAAEWVSGAGIILLSIVLAPSISMVAGSALFDVAAARIEKDIGLPAGRLVPLHEGVLNGFRIAGPAFALNILTLPLLFVPVINLIWFLSLNAYLMGREYFSLAAVRRMPWPEARALRNRHALSIFLVGFACSIIPFVAPLVGASAMTRLMKAITQASARTDRR